MPKQIFTQELEGTRRRVRHRKRWKEETERDLQVLGVRRWRELVVDRKKWKDIVRQAKARSGLQCQWKKKKKKTTTKKEEEVRIGVSSFNSQSVRLLKYSYFLLLPSDVAFCKSGGSRPSCSLACLQTFRKIGLCESTFNSILVMFPVLAGVLLPIVFSDV